MSANVGVPCMSESLRVLGWQVVMTRIAERGFAENRE
jgi:hypothetical protein